MFDYRETPVFPTAEIPGSTIAGLEMAERTNFDTGAVEPRIKWTFAFPAPVADVRGTLHNSYIKFTSTTLSRRSDAGKYAMAAGVQLSPNLGPADLVGRPVTLSFLRKLDETTGEPKNEFAVLPSGQTVAPQTPTTMLPQQTAYAPAAPIAQPGYAAANDVPF